MSPTPEQVAAQVAALVQNRPGERVVGIYSTGGWTGGESVIVNGSRWSVAVCRSPLEICERLSSMENGDGLVIRTLVPDHSLSLDVSARVAGRRLVHIDRWAMVREAFGARQIDPRLPMQGWLADALLAATPEAGFEPVPSGWLDADTAWETLLSYYLDIPTARPDAADIIQWGADSERVSGYKMLAEPLRLGVRDRLTESAGGLGELLATAIDAGRGQQLLPIGLVCGVLFPASGRRGSTLSQAIARLEPFVGGRTLTSDQGQAWYEAARSVLDKLPADQRRIQIERAEGLLNDLKASRFAGLSTVFTTGFQQRLTAVGKALIAYLDDKSELKEIEDAFREVCRHRETESNRERVQRLEMALKLARRLQGPSGQAAPTLGGAIESHISDGVYMDWARRYLLGGDPVGVLAEAFGRLYRRIRDIRESQNRVFAQRLRDWEKAPQPERSFLPVERFLDTVAAVVASKELVLVILVDGMDGGVFEELTEDLRRRRWVRWMDPSGVANHEAVRCLLSGLPSVTEFSRTALLTGWVASGSSATEKAGFANHSGLRSASRPSRPPVLFHKGDLTDAAAQGLAPAVRESIDNLDQRVVGVVVNAVDDHLAKSEQLRLKWSVDSFRILDALLFEARIAGRAVVLTSDHGHVLEEDGKRIPGSTEERWRSYGEPVAGEEMAFEGPRIQTATGNERIVLLWSEAARYSQKKNGYHGGATPQEVVVPLGVFLSVGQELEGWQPSAEYVPEWWLASAPGEVEAPRPAHKRGKKAVTPPKGQASLFETLERAVEPGASGWIHELVDSDVFAAQQRLAGRLAPPTTTVQEVLATLEARGSRVPRRILAQTIQVPEFRLRGILAGLQRLLNVDGYQVLSVEEETETVLLDTALLKKQFQLGD